jgi:hypothetical protein
METKFTKETWTFRKAKHTKRRFDIDCIDDNWSGLAVCYYTPGNKKIGKANARLIAAAPDMFEAICSLLEAYDEFDGLLSDEMQKLIDQCKAAIRKATNGQPLQK